MGAAHHCACAVSTRGCCRYGGGRLCDGGGPLPPPAALPNAASVTVTRLGLASPSPPTRIGRTPLYDGTLTTTSPRARGSQAAGSTRASTRAALTPHDYTGRPATPAAENGYVAPNTRSFLLQLHTTAKAVAPSRSSPRLRHGHPVLAAAWVSNAHCPTTRRRKYGRSATRSSCNGLRTARTG